MRKARKDHICTLCALKIESGTEYVYQRITPWDHPENESYGDYKAHPECDKFWSSEYGRKVDYEFAYPEEFRLAMKEALQEAPK